MPCFTAMRAEIALMSGSAFAVTHHAFSSGAGRTSDGNGSHASTLKSPSYTKSVSWQHYQPANNVYRAQYLSTRIAVICRHIFNGITACVFARPSINASSSAQ
ncbi:putative transposase [Shigella flexneri K-1770]|nr:transposase [Shigella flexneri VA-6]EIQ18317.1 putative transposase [Shigella flexneri K-1770]